MKKINLLPHKTQKAKDVRRITNIIAAVQVAIFLAAGLLFAFFYVWETNLGTEAQNLAIFLRESPAVYTGNETFHDLLNEEFLDQDALINVKIAPEGTWLYAIRFDHGQISVTARSTDILSIQLHIDALGEFFYGIRLANLMSTDYGYYIYELIFLSR